MNIVKLEPGTRFGRLRVVRRTDEKKGSTYLWLLRCDCGGEKKATNSALSRGVVQSCGCLQREYWAQNGARLKKIHKDGRTYRSHGKTKTPEYGVWVEMRRRCREEDRYVERGISVCARWQGREGFANFLADMGPRPSSNYTIERQNNDGNYEPTNCVWLLSTLQSRNRRNTVRLTLLGVTKSLAEWAEVIGIGRATLYRRYREGWSVEKILACG